MYFRFNQSFPRISDLMNFPINEVEPSGVVVEVLIFKYGKLQENWTKVLAVPTGLGGVNFGNPLHKLHQYKRGWGGGGIKLYPVEISVHRAYLAILITAPFIAFVGSKIMIAELSKDEGLLFLWEIIVNQPPPSTKNWIIIPLKRIRPRWNFKRCRSWKTS